MMKIVKNKVLITCIIIFLACATGFFTSQVFTAKAVVFDGGEYRSEYYIGEEVNILDGKFVQGGATIDANCEVIFPDGSTHVADKITIEQYGKYIVRYYSNQNKYEEKITFSVNQNLYEVKGAGKADYGVYTVKNQYWSNRDGVDRYEEIPGVITSLSPGASFVYNKVVDLKELNADQPLITLNVIAQRTGEPDFSRLNIRVTDIHNENNFLILRIKDKQVEDADWLSYCYVSINDEDVFYRGNVVTEGKYGISNMFSFRGLPGMKGNVVQYENCTSYKNDVLSYYVSHEKNEVFRMDSRNAYFSVCKLSETAANWQGFTTGEVKIEVFAELYKSATADFIIREIAGDSLTGEVSKDVKAPEITIDIDGEQSLAKKGFSYKVFDAEAYDTVDGVIEPQVMVYRNYHTNNKISVAVENGRFKTDYLGVYTICYTATDAHGNQSKKLVDVNVVDQEKEIEFTFGEGTITAKQGDKITIKDISASSGFGSVSAVASVTCNGRQIELVDNEFIAILPGEYEVSYTLTDYVGQVKHTQYKITVSQSDEPVLLTDLDVVLERNYIAGFEYPVPVIKMISYDQVGNSIEKNAEVSISNATVNGNLFTPKEKGTIDFTYKLSGYSYTEQRKVYSIYNGEDLDLNKMFITDSNVEVSYSAGFDSKYLIKDDCSIEFINKLLADGFSLSFNTEKGFANVGAVNVYVADIQNKKQTIKLTFKNDIDGVKFIVNDKTALSVSYSFNGVGDDFQLNLTAETGEVIVDKQVVKVLDYLNSEQAYSGFDSNKVYCRIEFEGVQEKGFAFVVKNVCGQNLSSTTDKDKIRPVVVFMGDYAGNRQKGEVYTLPEAVAGDVITPYISEFYLSVYGPNGDAIVCDGVELKKAKVDKYSFVLSEYGEYFVEYKAVDGAGRENIGGAFSIKVYDLEPPTIIVSGMTKSGNVGSTISIPKAIVEDNYASANEITIYVMIKNPKGVLSIVTDYKFKAELKGTYTVYYYVFDYNEDYSNGVSQGNLGSTSYEVTIG